MKGSILATLYVLFWVALFIIGIYMVYINLD